MQRVRPQVVVSPLMRRNQLHLTAYFGFVFKIYGYFYLLFTNLMFEIISVKPYSMTTPDFYDSIKTVCRYTSARWLLKAWRNDKAIRYTY